MDFIIKNLELTGTERVLDLACGYGRHSLELARRGYHVVGVDFTKKFIEDARIEARKENLTAEFILSDIRDISFCSEFDVVLNMADGAIGYLENEAENLKIFDVVSRALKPGGLHFMEIMKQCGMAAIKMYCDYDGTPASANGLQLMTISKKIQRPETEIYQRFCDL